MNKQLLGLIIIVLAVAGITWVITADDRKDGHDHPHNESGREHHDDHDEHEDKEHTDPSELVAKEPVRADGAFTITTSFYPLQFALERVAGDLADVTNIGAGQDPHDFRPTTQDILALQRSDLVILQGAEYEPWGHDVEEQLEDARIPLMIATGGLTLREAGEDAHHDEHGDEEGHDEEHEDEHKDEDEHAHGSYDPHTWLDPVLFSQTVEAIVVALSTLDPENAATYAANAEMLTTELAALNTQYETALATCALDEVITSHDAFGYLAARYEFDIHAIGGLSTQDLPSAQTLAELRAEAEEGVGAILLEENSVAAYGQTLAAETGLTTLSINPIAYVIPQGADYLTLMRSNLETFETALSCS